jgi:UDP-galactose-lipid carrier transferase
MTQPISSPLISSQSRQMISYSLPLIIGVALVISDVFSILISQYAGEQLITLIRNLWGITADFGGAPSSISANKNLFLILGFMTTALLWSKGLYTNRTPWWSQVQFILKITLFSLILHCFISLALRTEGSLIGICISWIFAFTMMTIARAVIYKIASFYPSWKIPTVIISDTPTAEDLVYAFSADISTGYDIKNIFLRSPEDNIGFDVSILPKSKENVRICYGQDDHETFICEHPDYFYIVSLDTFRDTARESLINTLNDNSIPYAIVPTLSRANLYQMEPKYFFGHDVIMLYVGNSAPQIFGLSVSRFLKRCMDIFASGMALLILSPLFITIALCLKIEGQGGSIFYGGNRIGKNNRLFKCYKFRSMEPNTDHLLKAYLDNNPAAQLDWEKYRKLPNDPRVTTKTARFIRKTSLDEIPQLWNIFSGDMSLVGPRPILEDETHYFEENTLKEYLSIRPGLTGLWQVSGRNKTSFKRRVFWDSWYVRNWSLWGDIVILIKTPIALLSRKGAS